MKSRFFGTAAPLITKIQKLFSQALAKENYFLRRENKILRSKLGKRVPLTDTDRRTLVRYGLPIKDRLWDIWAPAVCSWPDALHNRRPAGCNSKLGISHW